MNQQIAPIKLTPLYAVAEKLGAHFSDFRGWQLAESFSNIAEELDAARQSIVLADQSPGGKLYVEGGEAESVIEPALGVSNLTVGSGVQVNGFYLYRLRHDLYFANTPPDVQVQVLEDLQARARESGKFVTVTDATHGLAEIRIIGRASRDLLSKLCGLDFSSLGFPNHAVRQSSVAKIKQLIVRRDIEDLPAYSLLGAASFSTYLWDTIMDAGLEWDIRPVGNATIRNLDNL